MVQWIHFILMLFDSDLYKRNYTHGKIILFVEFIIQLAILSESNIMKGIVWKWNKNIFSALFLIGHTRAQTTLITWMKVGLVQADRKKKSNIGQVWRNF